MESMEIDSPLESMTSNISPRDRIVQRLAVIGVPEELLDLFERGLIHFVKSDRSRLREVVSAVLPTNEEVAEALQEAKPGSRRALLAPTMTECFRESMSWLQWLMFEDEPRSCLRDISGLSVGQRGICGAVWGHNDIAYRCKTCQYDPTCAICVPCFQNGDHKGHDFSVIYTGGGCCDCGDVTAWKREGFCSMHRGAEQIQPLPEGLADSVGPVLDSLFICWKNKLLFAEALSLETSRASDRAMECAKAATELTFVVVEMLLAFCKESESLLSFISKRVFSSVDLLELLVRAERFIHEASAKILHELLLKLLGEPVFKYEFAKVFIRYYPTVVSEAIKDCNDAVLKKFPLLPMFTVQIFTVPTLTPRLVKEMNLLTMLLECLRDIFTSCASDNGRLQVLKWGNLYEITLRIIEDIRFAMSHTGVPDYVTKDQQDIVQTWMRLLSSVQGMNPQKRETGMHIEDENEHMHLSFVLGHYIANIQCLLVDGAFSLPSSEDTDDEIALHQTCKSYTDDGDSPRHSKVGRISQESYACSSSRRAVDGDKHDSVSSIVIPSSVTWLIQECLKTMENWLAADNTSTTWTPSTRNISSSNFSALKKTLSKIRKGRSIFGSLASASEEQSSSCLSVNLQSGKITGVDRKSMAIGESGPLNACLDDVSFEGDNGMEVDSLRLLSLSDWPEIAYDVSSQEITVHVPLHRFLSMLLQRALRQCFGGGDVPAVTTSAIYNDFFGQVLSGCHPSGFSAFVMEHPLRIRVFCAEVHAGMWRKNGDAALLCCEWYRSVRWSEQGLELDLFLLQCCAAMAPPDLFIHRILDRFGISSYLSLNPERSNEYETELVQEMLILIIQIIKERRFCGLTKAESLRRELIYKLAIGDFTHSLLVKSLPRDLSKHEQLQEILDSVAVYSNPSGFIQGTYSLRWTLWNELDLYHPRWNSRDLQTAEERYLRARGTQASTNQLPKWSNVYLPLNGLARLATCKAVLQIVCAALFYAVFTDQTAQSRAPDGILLTSLHLLALALDICSQSAVDSVPPMLAFAGEVINKGLNSGCPEQSLLSLLVLLMRMHRKESKEYFLELGNCNLSSLIESLLKKFAEIDSGCMAKLQQLAPEVVSHIPQVFPNNDTSTNTSRPVSDSDKRKAKARERQAAILEKMRAEQAKFLASVDSSEDDGPKSEQEAVKPEVEIAKEESAQIICSLCHDPNIKSPVSFLILLQKSKLLSSIDRSPRSWELSGKIVDQRGGNISLGGLGKMSRSGEDAFMGFPKPDIPILPSASNLETSEQGMYLSVRREMQEKMTSSSSLEDKKNSTVEEGLARKLFESALLGKYIAAFSKEMQRIPSASDGRLDINRADNIPKEALVSPPYDGFAPQNCDGIFLSSCGHAVHQGCLDRYLKSLKERYNRRIVFEGGHIVDPDQGEFLCPVCRRLANSTLPEITGEHLRLPKHPNADSVFTSAPFLSFRKGLDLLHSVANAVGGFETVEVFSLEKSERMTPNLESLSRVLSKMYFASKHEKLSQSLRVSHSMLMWGVLKYSLLSMEIAARCGKKHLTPKYGLDALYKELESSSGFTLSLMLKIVQSQRSKKSVDVLQRFIGVQCFADSICNAVSMDDDNSEGCGPGAMISILKNIDPEVSYPDIQFWNRASDPIIAQDPFSSLMWLIFCLPHPFLSCEDSLLHLIHIFYAVTVVQAIAICYGKHPSCIKEASLSDSLVSDIFKLMGESGKCREYFVSNHVVHSDNIETVIRNISFPYLRRCALLWRLLSSSVRAPFLDRDDTSETSNPTIIDLIDSGGDTELTALSEVERLENMFKIPQLTFILTDEPFRAISTKWFHHFHQVLETRSFQSNIHCNPVVPFQLMQLPRVYQDLLQRCIKQSCPLCNSVIEDPALCLLCGRLCSGNWKPCCRDNGCQKHAMACGAGTGIFLLIRRTTILLQRSARQAPWPSPYLDSFGEEDTEMTRGKPLYLNEERYATLAYMVASHGLDRSSKVVSGLQFDYSERCGSVLCLTYYICKDWKSFKCQISPSSHHNSGILVGSSMYKENPFRTENGCEYGEGIRDGGIKVSP